MKHDGPVIAAIDFGAQSGLVLARAHAIAAYEGCELRVVHVHTQLIDRTELRLAVRGEGGYLVGFIEDIEIDPATWGVRAPVFEGSDGS